MKVVFGLLACILIIGFLLFKFGGLASYDPVKQAEEFKQAVNPGDTWQHVLQTRPPKTWSIFDYSNPHNPTGRSSRGDFDEDAFRTMMSNNTGPADGFIFEYVFDNDHAYDVVFDNTGKVTAINDAMTMNDLLQGGG